MKDKIRIIICDDDGADIKLFKKFLGHEKLRRYEVLEATDSEELRKLLQDKSNDADLLFLDYYLGAQSGLDLLKEIRLTNQVPVIMLTGRGDEETAVECMKEGAMDYIPKDTLPDADLAKIIQQAVDKWEIERERNQLLGIAAHELRNPLAVMLGYTEMLQTYEELDASKRNEIYEIIHERSNHLLNIINELLDITRIDKGIIVLKKKDIDLISLVRKKVKDYQFLADKKNIKLNFSVETDNLQINLDPDRIEEVLSNFIDNAIKYSMQNTLVEVSVWSKEDSVEIRIEDHGLGIKESELKYLFELFSSKKISTLPTGEESRTGLGLAISKKVVEAHGGQIFVTSEVGKGSTFSISFPVRN